MFVKYTILKDGTIAVRKQLGKPRKLTSKLCLALVLYFTRTRGAVWSLQILFGLSYTILNAWISFGGLLVTKILELDPSARMRDRTPEEWNSYVDAVGERHPALGRSRVGGTVDGLKLYIQSSPHATVQEIFYNGWTHDHYVTNVFLFVPDGTIAMSAMNAPGCMHDSTITLRSGMYDRMERVFRALGIRFTVDDAFNATIYNFLIKSGDKSRGTTLLDDILNREATSMRRSAEWGMRAFRASFPRVCDRIKYEEHGKRYKFIKMLVLLYNYRTNKVGINQIRNTYFPHFYSEVFGEVA